MSCFVGVPWYGDGTDVAYDANDNHPLDIGSTQVNLVYSLNSYIDYHI